MPMNNHQLLKVEEVAERLNVRQSTIRAWLLRRRIPFVKVGRCVRVRAEDIDRLLSENTIPSRGGK
jgi:excisionase family DNA binding protein